MDNIEQLKQDNAKLTERLNNAAKFFREQKAQIEALTKENDELKHDAESFNSLQENYENTIKSKDQAHKLLQDTYNEVFVEKEKLTEEIKELKGQIDSLEFNEESDASVINDYANEITEYKQKLTNVEESYEQLRKKYAARKEQEAELLGKVDELEKIIVSKDQAHKVLQDTYNEVFVEKEKLTEEIKEHVDQIRATEESYEQLKKSYEKNINISLELKDQYNELQNQYSSLKELRDEDMKKYIDIEAKIKKYDIAKGEAELKLENVQTEYKQKFEEQDNIIKSLQNENKETEEQFNKVLASYENDLKELKTKYDNLDKDYNELKANNEINQEISQKYSGLYDEFNELYEFVNKFMNESYNLKCFCNDKKESVKIKNDVQPAKSEVKIEKSKPTKTESKPRVINQEMDVQGLTINM